MKRSSQVNSKGLRPQSSPERAFLRRRTSASSTGPPTERDAPPFKPFPGKKPHVHETQIPLL